MKVEGRPATRPSPAPTSRPSPSLSPDSGLTRFLDVGSPGLAGAWLMMAFALGLAHAVQPGHGKTLIAAAGLGGVGSSGRGVALGALTAGVHLASVATLAALLWLLDLRRYDAVHALLLRGAGFAVALVGSFRLGRALSGSGGDHRHALGEGPNRPTPGLLALALAGGAVPCWDAVALLVVAHAAGRLAWGMVLLVAFSLGLGTVLVGVGWFAGRVRRRFLPSGGADSADPRARWLSGISALVLLVIGVALLART